MKYLVLFSLKDNEKVVMNVVFCSPGWSFKALNNTLPFIKCNSPVALNMINTIDQQASSRLKPLSYWGA